jgi:hypothetical protein
MCVVTLSSGPLLHWHLARRTVCTCIYLLCLAGVQLRSRCTLLHHGSQCMRPRMLCTGTCCKCSVACASDRRCSVMALLQLFSVNAVLCECMHISSCSCFTIAPGASLLALLLCSSLCIACMQASSRVQVTLHWPWGACVLPLLAV